MAETPTNEELGLGDLYKLLNVIAEAVTTGQTEVPLIKMRVAGKTVELGPSPLKVR